MSAGPINTRNFGEICRVYKNAVENVIAVDNISFTMKKTRVTDTRWHLALEPPHVKRENFYYKQRDRVVASIEMFTEAVADYDSGNYLHLVWNIGTAYQNNVEYILTPYVAVIGDTI